MTLDEKFDLCVMPEPNTGCWLWCGPRLPSGYARLNASKISAYAHRYSHERYIGPIPDGYEVDHLCRVRECCNPLHLEAVTGIINNRRSNSLSAQRARQTHCKRGHELIGDNLGHKPDGSRICLRCRRLRARIRHRSKKALVINT